ncbi:DUF4007 family protein [Mycobacterium sp. 5-140-3-2]|uniref:DUF4007 family protein n=1 Tax=Mycobacterium TaxID=1763 RepID=UPI001925AA1E|nr:MULTISPECIES: DUF4007 family protein [Mycobacterium]WRU84280.1 DUF4007 family protein [Mycobacterium sp. 5-140-3-2]WSE39576.1 DUF4007 family protein [Mycobacterium sp. 5-140-3-1]BCO83699.1 hypothetical protein MINTM011_20340 [Mycobacterium paraintracellulare]
MNLEQAATPMFANHQTFHPRFGWIKKGYDAAASDPNIFNEQSAPVELGVGKNMVEAIRFWSFATKVIARRPHPDRPRQSVYTPTHIGRALLDERCGFDPYLEDPATLWILHWQAISARSVLPVWRLAFNDFGAVEFTDAELLQFCTDEIAATTWSQPMTSSLQKDVDCLLRMYSRRETQGRQILDDLLDSPFRELGLIRPSPGPKKNAYRMVIGSKPTLSATAITYACLDYLCRGGDGSRTISLARLTADPGSPGRIMKLAEQDIADAIDESASVVGHLGLARPAGSRQMTISTSPGDVALEVLAARREQKVSKLVSESGLALVGSAATNPCKSDAEIERSVRKQSRARSEQRGDAA